MTFWLIFIVSIIACLVIVFIFLALFNRRPCKNKELTDNSSTDVFSTWGGQ